ncbi:MAG: helix-turn-helix domain-containing protein [Methylophilaceae bacterium]
MKHPTENNPDSGLPLPQVRCLSKEEAASYLGIGVTLLAELNIPAVKFGRRLVYDVVDLDIWLDEYKQRGRAGKEHLWLENKMDSTKGLNLGTGGLMQRSRTAREYEKVLGLKSEVKPKLI